MKPEPELDTLKAYILVKIAKQGTMLSLSTAYNGSSISSGFFTSLEEAQNQQMLEKLAGNKYNIYCLDIPVDSIEKEF